MDSSDHFCTSTSNFSHVVALFSWLDYCEQLISISEKSLGLALCDSIHEVFLCASLLPKLLKRWVETSLLERGFAQDVPCIIGRASAATVGSLKLRFAI